jgi:azurin
MDSTQHDSAENSGGFWYVTSLIFGIGLCAASIILGASFIFGGMKLSRAHGPQPAMTNPPAAPASAAPAAASATAPATAASSGEIVIKPGADNPLSYDIKSFTVKAGEKVKVTFNNQSTLPQPHNLILGKIGSKDRLIAAFTAMVTDPNGMAKGYIPESPDIIVHTKLLMPGQSETLEFTAPAEKGDYPYICSFPGHAIMMNGVMKVE